MDALTVLLTVASLLLLAVLVGGWTAAWLYWIFSGELRHALFAFVFPKAWRAGHAPSDILTLSHDDFEMFLSAESDAPEFIRGVLSCPGCLSAYISAAGTLLGIAGLFFPLFLLPLVWASAAWAGHRLYHHA